MRSKMFMAAMAMMLLIPALALAANGMNATAMSARSAGMGGADQAVATDGTAMNTNPAGITQNKMRVDASITLAKPWVKMSDKVVMPGMGEMQINKDRGGEPALFPQPHVTFTANVWDQLYLGLGFITQGGMGAEFKGLHTMTDPDPTAQNNPMTDAVPGLYDTYSQIMYMKLTPTAAYKFSTPAMDISLGATLVVGFSAMDLKHTGMQFPEGDNDGLYYSHDLDFAGDMTTSFGGRFGVLASFLDGMISVGASYQTKQTMDMTGTTKLDGQLNYDSKIAFAWPMEFGGGVGFRPLPNLLFAFDVKWINWSDTMDTVTFKNTAKGQVPPGYETMELPFALKWDDQVAIAAGAEYWVIPMLAVRLGYNYGATPVGPTGINQLFPATNVHHMTLGFGVKVAGLDINLAFEYTPLNEVESDATNGFAMDRDSGADNGYRVKSGFSMFTGFLGVGYNF